MWGCGGGVAWGKEGETGVACQGGGRVEGREVLAGGGEGVVDGVAGTQGCKKGLCSKVGGGCRGGGAVEGRGRTARLWKEAAAVEKRGCGAGGWGATGGMGQGTAADMGNGLWRAGEWKERGSGARERKGGAGEGGGGLWRGGVRRQMDL